MSDELDANTKALIAADDALRSARHFLDNMATQMFGAFVEPPRGSRMSKLMDEIKAAEESVQEQMRASLRKAHR